MKKEMFLTEVWQKYALRKMVVHAKSLGLNKGVAFLSVQKKGQKTFVIKFAVVNGIFQRKSRGEGDKGTNYFGIAMEKLAVMMANHKNSGYLTGDDEPKNGESRFRGGLVSDIGKYTVYVGFSGGTEDQDVEIATTGLEMMKQ
ncbi:MAG: hypothetical protein ACD_61C00265G0006 [uncultured bacterium]|nr:MAG: hypothetical protein ACD_61C00265G0006 [uncultured bacterium]